MKAISATAEIDADGWLNVHTRLPEKMPAGPVEAMIVLQPGRSEHEAGPAGPSAPSRQERLMASIRALRELGPIPGMEDPVAWQRSIREDRTLIPEE